jgi:hypothetical protein
MLVVTQVRQAPQHACVAGAISAARFSIGSAQVVARSSIVSVYAALKGPAASRTPGALEFPPYRPHRPRAAPSAERCGCYPAAMTARISAASSATDGLQDRLVALSPLPKEAYGEFEQRPPGRSFRSFLLPGEHV